MQSLQHTTTQLGRTSVGFERVRRSIHASRSPVVRIDDEPNWTPEFLRKIEPWPLEKLSAFGYLDSDVRRWKGRPDDAAMINTMQILTPEGVRVLAGICRALEKSAQTNDYVVTRRLRRVLDSSRFISGMVRDPRFLELASNAVGVPLIPHPYKDAAVQINYYYPSKQGNGGASEKVAKWHVDGMDYVFTMLLTDRSEFEGGDFLYFRGSKSAFDRQALHSVEQGRFKEIGDTLFARGSHVFHGVRPVTKGMRITLVISLFCPYFASFDGNRFWHSAPDDGLTHVLKTWLQFKRPGISPDRYAKMVEAPLTSWEAISRNN